MEPPTKQRLGAVFCSYDKHFWYSMPRQLKIPGRFVLALSAYIRPVLVAPAGPWMYVFGRKTDDGLRCNHLTKMRRSAVSRLVLRWYWCQGRQLMHSWCLNTHHTITTVFHLKCVLMVLYTELIRRPAVGIPQNAGLRQHTLQRYGSPLIDEISARLTNAS